MNITDYYEHLFSNDLTKLMDSSEFAKYKISMFSLIEGSGSSSHFGHTRKAFLSIEDKPCFLMSYFYTTLIDQALHTYDKLRHCDFNNIAKYPKLVGILSSYNSNMHPSNLLLISLCYIDSSDEEEYTNKFYQLTDYMVDDYENFIKNIFPKYTHKLNTAEQLDMLKSVYAEIISSMSFNSVRRLYHTEMKYSVEVYMKWLSYIQSKFQEKLDLLNSI